MVYLYMLCLKKRKGKESCPDKVHESLRNYVVFY